MPEEKCKNWLKRVLNWYGNKGLAPLKPERQVEKTHRSLEVGLAENRELHDFSGSATSQISDRINLKEIRNVLVLEHDRSREDK